MKVSKKEIEKYLDEEILHNPPLSSEGLQDIDKLLTKLLSESNEQIRKELRDFLKRWEIRTLFVDALQEQKDMTENKTRQN